MSARAASSAAAASADASSATPAPAAEDAQPCAHPVVYQGLCAACGVDVTRLSARSGPIGSSSGGSSAAAGSGAQAVVLGAAQRTIHLSAAALAERSQLNTLELLARRRLLAVLDLDHTLLHATGDARVADFVGREEDLFSFVLGQGRTTKTHFVKLRPHVSAFLEELSRLFDLHVYTMGARPYADAVVPLLDPQHRWIQHRVVSRDEGTTHPPDAQQMLAGGPPPAHMKSLKRMYPADAGLIAIVDDRVDVWAATGGDPSVASRALALDAFGTARPSVEREAGNARNVVRAHEYLYFNGREEMNQRPAQAAQRRQEEMRGNAPRQAHPQPAAPVQPALAPIRSKRAAVSEASDDTPTSPPAQSVASPVTPSATLSANSSGLRRRKQTAAPATPISMRLSADSEASPRAADSSTKTVIVIDEEETKESDKVAPQAVPSIAAPAAAAAAPAAAPVRAAPSSHPPAKSISSDFDGDDVMEHPDEADLVMLDSAPPAIVLQPQAAAAADTTGSRARDDGSLPIFPFQLGSHPFPDNVLLSLTAVLKAIHTLFYRQIDAATRPAESSAGTVGSQGPALTALLPLAPQYSVPRLISLLKRTTLQGCVIVFSGVFPTAKNADGTVVPGRAGSGAQRAEAWLQATSYGATCLEDFPERMAAGAHASPMEEGDAEDDEPPPVFGAAGVGPGSRMKKPLPRVTHIVAARPGSAKLHFAQSLPVDQRPHFVHVTWLWHSCAHFQRGDESVFPLLQERTTQKAEAEAPSVLADIDGTLSSAAALSIAQPSAVSASAVGPGGVRRRKGGASQQPSGTETAPSSAAPTSTPSVAPAMNSRAATPPPHSLYLIHHVRNPPTAASLVERVTEFIRAEEAAARAEEAQADLTLAQEMVKVAQLRQRRHSRVQASTGEDTPRKGRRVSFGGELGPSNPLFDSDVHTPPDAARPSAVALGQKRRWEDSVPGAPLDDVSRAQKERKMGGAVGSHSAVRTVPDEDDADVDMEDVLELDDHPVVARFPPVPSAPGAAVESDEPEEDAFDDITADLFDSTEGGDYGDAAFDDDE